MAYNVRRMGMRQVARQRRQQMFTQRRQRHSMRRQQHFSRGMNRSGSGSSRNRPIMARGGMSRPQGIRRRAAMHRFGQRFLGRGIGSRPGFSRPMARGRFTFPTRGY